MKPTEQPTASDPPPLRDGYASVALRNNTESHHIATSPQQNSEESNTCKAIENLANPNTYTRTPTTQLVLNLLLGSDLGRVAALPLTLHVSGAQNSPAINLRSWWHGEGDGRSIYGRSSCRTVVSDDSEAVSVRLK